MFRKYSYELIKGEKKTEILLTDNSIKNRQKLIQNQLTPFIAVFKIIENIKMIFSNLK